MIIVDMQTFDSRIDADIKSDKYGIRLSLKELCPKFYEELVKEVR